MKSEFKICLVTPSLKAGGLERVVSILANFGVNNFSIYIVTLDSTLPFYNLNHKVYLIQAPLEITNKNKKVRFFLNGFWLRKTLKKIDPDFVCSFGEKYNPFVLFFLHRLKFKIFVANRASPLSSLNGRYSKINPIAYRFADGVVLQTQKSLDLLKEKYNFKRTVVIANPIDLDLTISNKEKFILNVGSIGGNKNQDWLIKYFNELEDDNKSKWKLHFAGDGPLRNNLERLVYQLNLKNNVILHGIVKDTKVLYAKASIFAFTSTSEGFPNALAEAMAAGCACIAYDCIAGPSDIIDDEVNGFLIPLGNESLYKEKLKLLMNNSELREKFGSAAKEKMKMFEASVIADKFYQFITQEIENSN